jgi:hypothetical protein
MTFTKTAVFAIVIGIFGCSSTSSRVERLDGTRATTLPLKFDSVSGVRNGDTVKAEVRFAVGNDNIQIYLMVHLSPGAECTSADYHAVINGKNSEGSVTCESLAFQGGQDSPAIGGIFLLKDSSGSPEYRVSMPSTQMQRRFTP